MLTKSAAIKVNKKPFKDAGEYKHTFLPNVSLNSNDGMPVLKRILFWGIQMRINAFSAVAAFLFILLHCYGLIRVGCHLHLLIPKFSTMFCIAIWSRFDMNYLCERVTVNVYEKCEHSLHSMGSQFRIKGGFFSILISKRAEDLWLWDNMQINKITVNCWETKRVAIRLIFDRKCILTRLRQNWFILRTY